MLLCGTGLSPIFFYAHRSNLYYKFITLTISDRDAGMSIEDNDDSEMERFEDRDAGKVQQLISGLD